MMTVGPADFSPVGIHRSIGAAKPLRHVFPVVHTPYVLLRKD
jgi:hypothetical protein